MMLPRISTKSRVALGAALVVAIAAVLIAIESDPRLALFTPFDSGLGTDSNPWEISAPEQLLAIDTEDRYLSGSYVLADDVDWSDIDAPGFVGIGSADRPFVGTLDGRGHTIHNLTIRADGDRRVALFRRLEGTIEDLTLEGVDVDAPYSSGVAGLVAGNYGSVVEVDVEGAFRGRDNVGAVVGYNGVDAEVRKATATGEVVGDVRVGGVVGQSWGVVADGKAGIDVRGDIRVGGLVGLNAGAISHSKAAGEVIGANSVGGLVGESGGEPAADTQTATIEKSVSTGRVKGQQRVGGLVGNLVVAAVTESRSGADVSGTTVVGGLVGAISEDGRVVASEASGAVDGDDQIGGFVGWNGGEVVDSLAVGAVEGDDEVGGFAGKQKFEGAIRRSYSTGEVAGRVATGGFAAAVADRDLVEDSYWNVDTSGLRKSAGGTGLSGEEFSDPDSFAGFSFCPAEDCRWEMDGNEGRPVLSGG